MFGPIIVIAAQLSASLPNAYERITPQVAAKRVAGCGVGPVTVKSDADLDTDVLVVAASSVSDEQLACMVKSASFYDVELPPSVQPRFNEVSETRSAALKVADAREWLRSHKLLARIPKYKLGITDDVAFSHAIEKLCHADQALQSRYGPHALSPEWTMQHATDARLADGPMACLLNVASATGFKMGLVGNEQAAP